MRIIAILCMLLACACANRVQIKPTEFAAIKTFIVEDATSPLLLEGSDAGKFAPLLRTGLETRGYSVCKEGLPCKADARVVLRVDEFRAEPGGGWNLMMPMNRSRGESRITAQFEVFALPSNSSILQTEYDEGEHESLRQHTYHAVKRLTELIPQRTN